MTAEKPNNDHGNWVKVLQPVLTTGRMPLGNNVSTLYLKVVRRAA